MLGLKVHSREMMFTHYYSLIRTTPCNPWYKAISLLILIVTFFSCAGVPAQKDMNKAEAHYKLGLSHALKNEYSEAYIDFQKAIELNPRHKESLNYLGFISTRFSKYDEAVSYYERAISIDRKYSEAMNNLGVLYLETKNWDEAIRYLLMALQNPVYPTPEKAYSNLGLAYLKKDDYQRSRDAINEALTRFHDYPWALHIRGLLLVKQHDDDLAINEFLKVLRALPEYREAHWEIAKAYVRTGERDKAIKHFKKVAESGNGAISHEAMEYIKLLEKR